MTEPRFLLYFPDPYGVGNSRFAVAEKSSMRLVTAQDIYKAGNLITYDVPALIDDLRRANAQLPDHLTDMSDAIRLITGISRADGGEKKWGFWRKLKPFFGSDREWRQASNIHSARAPVPDGDELIQIFGSLANAIVRLWDVLLADLDKSSESVRFFEIEQPVANIFHHRQYVGIPVLKDGLNDFIKDASSEKYRAYQEVAKELDISATGLTYWNVGPYLKGTDFDLNNEDLSGYALRDQMKIAAANSEFARNFTTYLDTTRDLDTLTRLADDESKVFPTFQCIGTISSRILVADPHLQELRRRYRSAIVAEPGYTLQYFDYSQFEPAIMAALSDDKDLIRLYNDGDIYKALSCALFGDEGHRDLCKRVFLAFSYGMSIGGISALLVPKGAPNTDKKLLEGKINTFFNRFKSLLRFKENLEGKLQTDGFVSTLVGNRRLRTSSGNLTSREKRWAVSQVIQGNASLIFKTALLGLKENFDNQAFLLPVHDAILMQFPIEENLEELSQKVIEQMKLAFEKYCPGINIRVSVGNFH